MKQIDIKQTDLGTNTMSAVKMSFFLTALKSVTLLWAVNITYTDVNDFKVCQAVKASAAMAGLVLK